MCIGNHPKLIILHVLNEELENIFDGNVILGFAAMESDVITWGNIPSWSVTHGFLIEIFGNQIL